MADRSTNCNHFRRSLTSRGKGSPLVWPFRLGGDAEPRSRDHGSTHPPVRDHAVVEDRNGEPANKLIGKTGTPFWQREYYDRWIRSPKELSSVIAYVEDNPVRTGLAASPEEWRWSSAFKEPAARPPALPQCRPLSRVTAVRGSAGNLRRQRRPDLLLGPDNGVPPEF
jgi:hypothetical protein